MPLFLLIALALLGLVKGPAKMPRTHPKIAHFKGYLYSDGPLAIRRVARAVRRWWGIDRNWTVDAQGVVWVNHWSLLRKGSWMWLWTGKYVWVRNKRGKRVRVEERVRLPYRTRIETLPTEKVARVRSAKRGGRRMLRASEDMPVLRGQTEVYCAEAKGSAHMWPQTTCNRVAAQAERSGAQVVVMMLSSQGGWDDVLVKCQRFYQAGFRHLAVLPRSACPPDIAAELKALGVQKWDRRGW